MPEKKYITGQWTKKTWLESLPDDINAAKKRKEKKKRNIKDVMK